MIQIIRYITILFLLVGSMFFSVDVHSFSLDTYAEKSILSTGKWVRVEVTENGIHAITRSDLSKWGFKDMAAVRVFGYGGAPISEVLTANGYVDDLPQVPVIRTSSGILFYAQSHNTWKSQSESGENIYLQVQHPYATKGSYFITEDAAIPDLLIEKSSTPISGGDAKEYFMQPVFHEMELLSPGMTGRTLLGEEFRYSSSQSFKFKLPDYVEGSDVILNASFAAKVIGGSSTVSYRTGANDIVSTTIKSVVNAAYEHYKVANSTSRFKASGEDVQIGVDFKYSGSVYLARLDYINLNYRRKLRLSGSQLQFHGYSDADFMLADASEGMRVIEVTDIKSPREMNVTLSGTNLRFGCDAPSYREFVAFKEDGSFPSPIMAEVVKNQNLHGLETPDMVILTPLEFKNQAQRIADFHKEADGFNVLVVTPQEVYNEFSSGTVDLQGIRKMLKMFYDRSNTSGGLKHFLLFGRGSYDNRRISETMKSVKYPMLLSWQSVNSDNENTSYTSDDFFVMLEDNSGTSPTRDKISISVGRMPVKSDEEAKTVVNKMLSYVANKNHGSWKNNVLVIADDEDNAEHMIQADTLINVMKRYGGSSYIYNRVYTDATIAQSNGAGRFYPDARRNMFNKFGEGVLWAHYIGHANPVSWTHDGLLTLTDIREKMYYRNLPLLYTATCEFSRWDADEISGGEMLFLNSRGGAIALMSTTRVAFISANGALSRSVGTQVFARDKNNNYQRIGDILRNAKNNNGAGDDNKLRYSLLGNPAMRLVYPSYSIKINSINGESVNANSQPTLRAGESVEIAGSIVDNSGLKASDFTGYVVTKLYDAETSVVTNGYGENGTEYLFYDRNTLLHMGRDSVADGDFAIRFKMPQDITNNWSPALLNLYASSESGVEANGNFSDLYVYGYADDVVTDTVGPKIEYFYINSSTFKSGDNVNEVPMVLAAINDPSGINVSLAGVGHQLSLTLDGVTTYTDVMNFYTPTVVDGIPGGIIAYPVAELQEGKHSLRLRAWDNCGNSSTATVEFNVVKGLAPQIIDVFTDANPAKVEANFYVRHNRPEGNMIITIEVFDLMGHSVWSATESGRNDMLTSFPITWNLCDFAGRRVPRGIYLYRATVSTDGIQATSAARKLAVASE